MDRAFIIYGGCRKKACVEQLMINPLSLSVHFSFSRDPTAPSYIWLLLSDISIQATHFFRSSTSRGGEPSSEVESSTACSGSPSHSRWHSWEILAVWGMLDKPC